MGSGMAYGICIFGAEYPAFDLRFADQNDSEKEDAQISGSIEGDMCDVRLKKLFRIVAVQAVGRTEGALLTWSSCENLCPDEPTLFRR